MRKAMILAACACTLIAILGGAIGAHVLPVPRLAAAAAPAAGSTTAAAATSTQTALAASTNVPATPQNVIHPPSATCPNVMMIAARGIGEAPLENWEQASSYTSDSNYGAGKTLADLYGQLTAARPDLKISLEPVVYPVPNIQSLATLKKALSQFGPDAQAGAANIVAEIKYFDKQCGGTVRYILAGYSLGAWAVHDALYDLKKTSQLNEVAGVALFGDPKFVPLQSIVREYKLLDLNYGMAALTEDQADNGVPSAVAAQTGSWCFPLDPVCQVLPDSRAWAAELALCAVKQTQKHLCAHFQYPGTETAKAAAFLAPLLPKTIQFLSTPPGGIVGKPYSWRATATATSARPTTYTWSTKTPAYLPPGLHLASTGVVAGTPTTAGTYTFGIAATDRADRTTDGSVTIVVGPGSGSDQTPPSSTCTGTCTVWAWGHNPDGELGNGTTTDSWTPVQVSDLTGITAIAGGTLGGYALKSDGTVWAWGNNAYGELGDGTTTNSSTPVQVSGLTGITAIADGGASGYALKSDGTVWAWGIGRDGELGNGTFTTDSSTPVQVSGLTGITAIAGRDYGGYALKSDGTVWAWGYGGDGGLGNGTTTDSWTPVQVSGLTGITAIAGGQDDGYALKSGGTVWAWGWNVAGGLGNGTTTNSWTPVQVSGLTGITAIAGGSYGGYALKSGGTVWAWGDYGGDGGLGDGTTTNSSTPVQVSGLTGATAIASGQEDGYALVSAP